MNLTFLIHIMPLILGVLGFAFIFSLFHTYTASELFATGTERMEQRMKKKKKNGSASYNELTDFLLRNGASEHFGDWISPASYLMLRIGMALLLGILGMSQHLLLLPVGFIGGYLLPQLLILEMNRDDNSKMSEQIATVYNTLQIQTEAGIELVEAATNMAEALPDGRLAHAFEQLSAEVSLSRDFEAGIEHFNKKFDNEFIDALCVIMQQGAKTGRTQDLMRDISAQIADMQAANLASRKEKIDRFVTFAIMALMVCGMAIVIYAFAQMMVQLAGTI